MNRIISLFVIAVIVLFIGTSMLFIVDQRSSAAVFRLRSGIHRVINKPGIHFKMPFPIENVESIDKRIRILKNDDFDRYATFDKKNLFINLFLTWRIIDVRRYFVNFGGSDSFAESELKKIVRDAFSGEFSKQTLHQVISKQNFLTINLIHNISSNARDLGIEVLDLRTRHFGISSDSSDIIYQHMILQSKKIANRVRSLGISEIDQIRADADRQHEVILSDAYKKAQIIMGEGDAEAASIYDKALKRNLEFYSFYKSLQIYRDAFSNKNDLIITDPSNPLFRFMKDINSKKSISH